MSPNTNVAETKRSEEEDRPALAFATSASRHCSNDKEWLDAVYDSFR
jgi:hypothetical protein